MEGDGTRAALGAADTLDWVAMNARGLSGLMKHAQNSPLDFSADDMEVFVTVLDEMARRADEASAGLA